MARKLLLLTNDPDVIEDIETAMKFFKDWTIRIYHDIESSWAEFFQFEPDLCIVDLDSVGSYKTNLERRKVIQERSPLIVFVSSRAIFEEPKADWVSSMRVMDYIQKPVDLDKIIFSFAVIDGIHTK
jgi:DNA-binding NtrC family response regulator